MSRDEIPASVGPYEILEEIGRGTTGVVYKARHRELDRIVALKVVDVANLAEPAEADRFLRGAKAAAKLDHPGLVRVFEVGRDGGHLFAAMTLVEGNRLADRLAKSGPMSTKEAAALVRQLAGAVAHAHKNQVLHRNLDPDSVLFDASGRARLTGFGMARLAVRGDTLTSAADSTATGFTAPELISASGRGGTATDVYGLGAILYAALTAQPPVQAANAAILSDSVVRGDIVAPSKRIRKLPRTLEAICLRCLATDPAQRYPNAEAVATALAEYGTESDDRQGAGPKQRRPLLLRLGFLVGTIAFLAAAAVGLWPLLRNGPTQETPAEASPPGIALFNGKDLSGWEVHGPNVWEAVDGEVRANTKDGQFSFLTTEKKFQDFEVRLDYKIPANGDTGIFLRMNLEEDTALHAKGEKDFFVEVQLVGSAVQSKHRTGAIWERVVADPEPKSADDAWNQASVRVVGNRVTVTINGTRCVDADVSFRRSVGQIALQSWQAPAAFRNVRLVDLSASTPDTLDDATLARAKALIEQLDAAEKVLLEDPSGRPGEPAWEAYTRACEGAFRTFGIELTRPAGPQAELLKQLPKSLRERIVHAMDAWDVAADAAGKSEAAGRIRTLAGLVDTDPWRGRVRTVRANPGAAGILPIAAELSKSPATDAAQHDLIAQILLSRSLLARPETVAFFRDSAKSNPTRFWPNLGLAISLAEDARKLTGEVKLAQFDLALAALDVAKATKPNARVLDGPREAIEMHVGSLGADRDLAEWVLKQGGRVVVRGQKQPQWQGEIPVLDSANLPAEPFRVIGVSLSNLPVGDADLAKIATIRRLEEVHLAGTKVTDNGLRPLLRAHPALVRLNVEGAGITDAIAGELRGVKEAYLRRTKISAETVAKWTEVNKSIALLHESLAIARPPAVARFGANGAALRLDWYAGIGLPISLDLGKAATIEGVITIAPELLATNSSPFAASDSSTNFFFDINKLFQSGAVIQKNNDSFANAGYTHLRVDRTTHVALVFDGKEFRWFEDGKRIGATSGPFATSPNARCQIGGNFVGLIREVRFSATARYSKDFTPVDRHEPDEHTVGLYHLDEGEGDVAHDSSGKNNHGKIVNAKWAKGKQ